MLLNNGFLKRCAVAFGIFVLLLVGVEIANYSRTKSIGPPSCLAETAQRNFNASIAGRAELTSDELLSATGMPQGVNLEPIPGYDASTTYWVYKFGDGSKMAISMLIMPDHRIYHVSADFVKSDADSVTYGDFNEFRTSDR